MNLWAYALGANFMLENSLFRAIILTKNADYEKHKYSGYDIGFDARIFPYLIAVSLVKM